MGAAADRNAGWRKALISASHLRDKLFSPIKFVIPDYVPEGVTIFAGKPKIGKSWLLYDVCLAVAAGRFVLGAIRPTEGDVLYLALEDSSRRLKQRLQKLWPDGAWPERLKLATEWRKADAGGVDDIAAWCDSVSKPVLVVIDTLEKFRPQVRANFPAYSSDYAAVEGLHKLAHQRGLAIVVIHHVRKMDADDPFDTVSGTNGLTGAADTILVLKRQSSRIPATGPFIKGAGWFPSAGRIQGAKATTMPASSQQTGKPAGKWPADKVERWPIERLVPYARNARTHSPAQVDQIAGSIREWGWTNPVLVGEDGTIIAGHGRVLGARKLRIPEVPVMVAIGWTDAQKRAYAIADNKLTLNGGWDEKLLGLELGELEVLGFDLELIGFSEAERAALAAQFTEGLTDPDVVPDLPAIPVSRTGDVWVSRDASAAVRRQHVARDVQSVLAGVKPHLMVTDPPYGVNYDPRWRKRAGVNLNPLEARQGRE